MNVEKSIHYEAQGHVSLLSSYFPNRVDGREAILQMKSNDSNNWKQMEWIGFYFEEEAISTLPVKRGPTISGTTFDAEGENVWDFKTHTKYTASGNKRYEMYLNDAYSMEQCIENGGMGFIVAYVEPEYDGEERQFYQWHQELKGGDSKYTKNRKSRGASSRRRKTAFEFIKISAYWIDSLETLSQAEEDGWIARRGQGRNCNGDERSDKYVMKPHNIPESVVVAERKY